jgi:hypothetical protein
MDLPRRFRRGSALIALVAIFSGCSGEPGPKEALRDYFTAIAEGNLAAAFEALTPEAHARLGAAAARTGSGQAFDLFRSRMTTGGPGAVPWITRGTLERIRIDVAREDAGSATLRVTSPLGSADVRMVRHDDRWLVDLAF